MFTAAEYRLIRENCLADLQKLLAMLNMSEPNWNVGDEFRIYEKVDEGIIERVCRLMKSESVIEGYTKLMTLGGLPFDYSETDNELLATILKNKDYVMRGATQAVSTKQTVTENRPQKITKTVEEKKPKPAFIAGGIGLILIGIGIAIYNAVAEDADIGMAVILIPIVAGVAGLIIGFNGETVTKTVTVDGPPAQKKVTAETKKAAFTESEIRQVFEILSQINKIVRSI